MFSNTQQKTEQIIIESELEVLQKSVRKPLIYSALLLSYDASFIIQGRANQSLWNCSYGFKYRRHCSSSKSYWKQSKLISTQLRILQQNLMKKPLNELHRYCRGMGFFTDVLMTMQKKKQQRNKQTVRMNMSRINSVKVEEAQGELKEVCSAIRKKNECNHIFLKFIPLSCCSQSDAEPHAKEETSILFLNYEKNCFFDYWTDK